MTGTQVELGKPSQDAIDFWKGRFLELIRERIDGKPLITPTMARAIADEACNFADACLDVYEKRWCK